MKEVQNRRLYLRAAVVLTIISSLIALVEAMFFFYSASLTWEFTHASYYGWRVLGVSFFYYLTAGVLGVTSFFLGFASGIFVSERKRIKFSMVGLSMLVIFGITIFSWLFISGSPISLSGVALMSLFGLPILVPSGLSLVLVDISKTEYKTIF